MTERTKQILGFVALFGTAGLIGLGMYILFFRAAPLIEPTPDSDQPTGVTQLPTSDIGAPVTPTTPTEPTTPGVTPSDVAEGGPTLTTRLTSSSVRSATIMADGSIAYYDPNDGRFYTIDENGNIIPISDTRFPDAETVVLSDNAQVAALEFPDGSNIIYDFESESQTTLPSHWEEFDFSPDSEIVASKSLSSNPNSNTLVVTATDGTGTQVVAPLGNSAVDVTLNWSPNGNVVGFSETGTIQSNFGTYEIFLIGEDGEASGKLVTEGTNFSATWAPDNSAILYSVAESDNSYKSALWVTDSDGSNRRRLGVQTWVEKCTFSSSTEIYCAIPREFPIGGGEDHSVVTAPDDVYKININSGRATLIAQPVLDLQMFDLSVTDAEDLLYFADQNGLLNFIRLR